MSIKKIENLNIHENPSTNQDEFDIENYLNANWNKIKDVVDNNADELVQMHEEYNKKETEQDKEIEEIKIKDANQDNLIKQLQEENKELKEENSLIKEQIPNGNIVGNSIHIEDSSNLEMSLKLKGGYKQETKSIDDGDEYNTPSPDYPSEIETVKDNVTMEVCNKNILDYTKLTAYEKYSIIETQIDGGIRITCRDTQKTINAKYIVTSLESYKGQKLTISTNIKSNSSNKGMVLLSFGDKNGGNRSGSIYTEEKTNGRVSLTITIPETLTENTSYLCLLLYGRRESYDDAKVGDYVDYTNIQLEVSSVETDYTPHQSQSITIPIQQEMLEGDYIDEVEHHEWGKIESYNGETVETEYISTTGELTTGAIIYYKLAEPLDLELTSEQKAIMKQKVYTYKNITNIDIDNELASLDVIYKKDIEIEHNKLQNQIDEIKQLISTTETSALLLENLQKEVESEV